MTLALDDLRALYCAYVNGAQTTEKHVRWSAERLVKEVEGGFANNGGASRPVQWMDGDGEMHYFNVKIPAGMHGFALQLVLEDQIREGLR